MASNSDDLLLSGPWSHRMVHVRGQRLHVAEVGAISDPLVLFLHGSTGGWFEWRYVLQSLVDGGFVTSDPQNLGCHAVALSLRGYAPSDRTPHGYSPNVAADDAAGVIRAMGHSRAIVVGHGLGAWIAWTLAARNPQLVDSLIISGAVHPRTWVTQVRRAPWSSMSRSLMGSRLVSRPNGRRFLTPSRSNDERVAHMVAHAMSRAGVSADGEPFAQSERGLLTAELMNLSLVSGGLSTAEQYADWWTKPWPPSLVRWLSQLTQAGIPDAQLIAGELDSSTPAKLLEASASHHSGSGSAANPLILPGVGHFPPVEAPDAIVAAVVAALASLRP